jgi:hypothetical protein
MNPQTFWQLMDVVKEKSGSDMMLRYDMLVELLTEYEPFDILRFKNIAEVYADAAAENKGVWAACRVMEGLASDDVYMNFCCWLITEGKETYLEAVKNPESLATEEMLAYSEHSIGLLSFVAFDAFQRKAGKSVGEITDAEAEILIDEQKQLSIELLKNIDFMDDTPFAKDRIEAIRQIPVLLPKLTVMFGYDPEADIRKDEL